MNIEIEPISFTLSLTAILTAFLAAVWWLARNYATKRVEYEFQKRIEKHKSELQSIFNFNNFGFGRKLQEFNLFITKKHEVYPILFELYLKADGYVGGLRGLQTAHNYLPYSAKQIELILVEDYQMPRVYFEDILRNWDSDKEALEEKFLDFMKNAELQRAKRALAEAKNNTLIYGIYLSSEIADSLKELHKLLNEYVFNFFILEESDATEQRELKAEMRKIKGKVTNMFPEIKRSMQEELGRGDKFAQSN
ncbi:hypothetical protein [Paenibacillus odorifer]|uniref:Uncharacterized protein n=1 Tax=Paenibacillus odorifer TaxID=189426 RepID=A0ABX3GU61_9BACL|nr:hypothetical protein [Paenibacillus odorifer]OMD34806.1 hypothetical protein BSO21_10320 [Paenibacillus odorifer]